MLNWCSDHQLFFRYRRHIDRGWNIKREARLPGLWLCVFVWDTENIFISTEIYRNLWDTYMVTTIGMYCMHVFFLVHSQQLDMVQKSIPFIDDDDVVFFLSSFSFQFLSLCPFFSPFARSQILFMHATRPKMVKSQWISSGQKKKTRSHHANTVN